MSDAPETGAAGSHGRARRLPGLSALIASTVIFFTARTTADPDLWGHVRFGRLILERGRVPRADPFSYLTAGYEWMNHEWLSQVILAGIYGATGATGLILLKLGVVLTVVALLLRHFRRRGLGEVPGGLLLLLVGLLLIPNVRAVRPQLFTLGGFLVVLLAMEGWEKGERRLLWILPPVFVVWVNLHGGFVAGLAVLGLWSTVRGFGELRRGGLGGLLENRDVRDPILVALLSLCAPLVNPYGWDLPVFLVRSHLVQSFPSVSEWRPLEIVSPLGGLYILAVAAGVVALNGTRVRREPGLVAVFGALAVTPLLAVRHVPLVAVATAVICAEHLASTVEARRGAWPDPGKAEDASGFERFQTVSYGLAGLLVILTVPQVGCVSLRGTDVRYPVTSVALLERAGATGRMVVPPDWGGFVIWHLGPSVQVSIDSRLPVAYPDSVYRAHLRFLFGRGDWDGLLKAGKPELALVPHEWAAYNLMRLKTGWKEVMRDPAGGVFAKVGSGWSPRLEAVRDEKRPETASCFP